MKTFVCDSCKLEFEVEEGDEERAEREKKELWPEEAKAGEDFMRVCDNCFQSLMKRFKSFTETL